MIGVLLIGSFLATVWFFARRQDRLNRAMDAMQDAPRDAGYVGPNLPGPGGTTGL